MGTSLSDRITIYLSLTTPVTESSTSHAMFKGLNKTFKLRSYSAKAHLSKKPLFRGTEQSPSALNPKNCHLNHVPPTTTWPEGLFSAAHNLSGWAFAFLVPICLKHFWGPQALCWIEFLLLGVRLESLSRTSGYLARWHLRVCAGQAVVDLCLPEAICVDVECFLKRREGKALMPHRRRRNSGRKWDMNFSFQNKDMDGIQDLAWVLPGNAGCRSTAFG